MKPVRPVKFAEATAERMTAARQREIWSAAYAGDKRAEKIWFEACRGRVRSLMRKKFRTWHNNSQLRPDMESAGMLACVAHWKNWQGINSADPLTFLHNHIHGALQEHVRTESLITGTQRTDSHGKASIRAAFSGARLADDRLGDDPEILQTANDAFTTFHMEPFEDDSGEDSDDSDEADRSPGFVVGEATDDPRSKADNDSPIAEGPHDDSEALRADLVIPSGRDDIDSLSAGRGVTFGGAALSRDHDAAEKREAREALILERMEKHNPREHKVFLAARAQLPHVAQPVFDTSAGKRLTDGIANRAWNTVYNNALRRYLRNMGWLGTHKESEVWAAFRRAQQLFLKYRNQITAAETNRKAAEASSAPIVEPRRGKLKAADADLLQKIEEARTLQANALLAASAQRAAMKASIPSRIAMNEPFAGSRWKRSKGARWNPAAHGGLSWLEFIQHTLLTEYGRWLDSSLDPDTRSAFLLPIAPGWRRDIDLWHVGWQRRTGHMIGFGAWHRRCWSLVDFEALGFLGEGQPLIAEERAAAARYEDWRESRNTEPEPFDELTMEAE